MKFTNFLRKNLTKTTKVLMASALFGGLAFGSSLSTAIAEGPQFNSLPQDLPTLQVATPGGAWGTGVSAQRGDTLNLLLWDNNDVVNTTALNVRLRIALNDSQANPTASGFVSADNAATASSDVTVNTGGEVDNLTYVPGSAVFYNDVANNSGGYTLTQANFPAGVTPDNIVSNGINIGNQGGCWCNAHAVQIQVKVQGGAPAIITNKAVALDGGSQNYTTSTTASPSDKVDFRIFLQNDGTMTGTDPEIIDPLDSHLTYVPNSSYMVIKQNNGDVKVPLEDSMIKFQGNTITWAFDDMAPVPNAALYLYFQATVAATSQFNVGTTNLQNCATSEFSNATPVTTNCVTIAVNKTTTPVITFNFHKEVTNLTLDDSVWHHDFTATAAPGDELAYRLTITNTGNTPAQNVTLKDVLPAGLTFDGNVELYDATHPNGEALSGNDIVNNGVVIPTVTNGSAGTEQLVFDATVNTGCVATQTITNVGDAYYQNNLVGQDSVPVIVSCSKTLIIDKQIATSQNGVYSHDAGTVKPGSTLYYNITAINNGSSTIVNPLTYDVLPTNETYVPNTLAVDGQLMDAQAQAAYFGQGILLTNLTPGMGKTITYQTVVINSCPTTLTIINTAYAKADNAAQVSDSAQAEIICAVIPTPTPPTTPTPTTPGTPPQLPHTGGEDIFTALAGMVGTGFSGRWYLLKNRLKKQAKNIHIL